METAKIKIKTKILKKEIKLLLKTIKKNELSKIELDKQLKDLYDEIINTGAIILND